MLVNNLKRFLVVGVLSLSAFLALSSPSAPSVSAREVSPGPRSYSFYAPTDPDVPVPMNEGTHATFALTFVRTGAALAGVGLATLLAALWRRELQSRRQAEPQGSQR